MLSIIPFRSYAVTKNHYPPTKTDLCSWVQGLLYVGPWIGSAIYPKNIWFKKAVSLCTGAQLEERCYNAELNVNGAGNDQVASGVATGLRR